MLKKPLELKILNNSNGFTLIELLVTVAIIGLLGAISLPNYLNQTSKARGAEGKSNLSTINRAQQVHRFMQGRMAGTLNELDSRVTGKYYSYTVSSSDKNNASATAVLIPAISMDLRNYSAAVTQIVGSSTQQEFFGSVICETSQNNVAPSPAVAPITQGGTGSCVADMKLVN